MLCSVRSPSGSAESFFPCFDANGNVVNLVAASDGAIAAAYEYGPFGQLIRSTGPMAGDNPIRWSTKHTDDETGLIYYGYRWYDPERGKWLSRDPLGEQAGPNLTAFCRNDPLNYVDPLGLWTWDRDWLETILYLVAPVSKKGRAAAHSFWVESGGAQAREMWEGVKVIAEGDFGMAREQMIEDTAEHYYQRIMMHQAVSGGDIDDAIASATGWRMVGADLVGFTELDEARTGLDYTYACEIGGEERTRRAFVGTGKFAGTVAFVGGSGQSLAAGYKGTGLSQTWRWMTTFKHGGRTYYLLGSRSSGPGSVLSESNALFGQRTILQAGDDIVVPAGTQNIRGLMSDLTASSGNEVALLRLNTGLRVIRMGGPASVRIGSDVTRVIAHTHPSGNLSLSLDDIMTVHNLGGRSTVIIDPKSTVGARILLSLPY